jgi:hypothetical protein
MKIRLILTEEGRKQIAAINRNAAGHFAPEFSSQGRENLANALARDAARAFSAGKLTPPQVVEVEISRPETNNAKTLFGVSPLIRDLKMVGLFNLNFHLRALTCFRRARDWVVSASAI